MVAKWRVGLILSFWLSFVSLANGQILSLDDPPKPYPAKKSVSEAERKRRDSLYQYALGLLCERDDRLLEALKAYEAAALLDPQVPAVFKAQVPLLLALERTDEALKKCDLALKLDDQDYELWYAQARIQRALGRMAAAKTSLNQGLASRRVSDRPDVEQQMLLDLGELFERANEPVRAAEAYQKALDILEHPDRVAEAAQVRKENVMERAADTYEKIATLFCKSKKYEEAAKAYQKAQQRSPERAGRIHFNLAQINEDQGDLRSALVNIDAYLRMRPSGMEAYEKKIQLHERLKERSSIVPWLEQAAKVDTHNMQLQLLLARELGKAGLHERSERHYKTLAAIAPNPDVYQGLFRLVGTEKSKGPAVVLTMLDKSFSEGLKKTDGNSSPPIALAHARAMLEAVRKDRELARDLVQAGFREDSNPLQFETLHLLAVLAERQRKFPEAEAFFRRCLELANPDNEALIHGGLQRVLLRARKYDEVISLCKAGLQEGRPTNRLLFLSDLARAHAAKADYPEALRWIDRGIEQAGDQHKPVFHHLRVRVLGMSGQFDEAEKLCEHLLKDAPLAEMLELRLLLSSIHSMAKKNDLAEQQLEIVLRIDPNHVTACNDLGYMWADQKKNLDKAEELIRKALALDRRQRKQADIAGEDQDNAAFVDSLGWVLFRRGQFEEARKELERATAMPDGEDPVLFDHLGDVYMRLQMPKQAREAWQRSIQLFEQGARQRDERYQEIQRKLRESSR